MSPSRIIEKAALALFALAFSLSAVSSCDRKPAAPSKVLIVLAASSLTEAFTAAAKEFEGANTDTKVLLNFGGSNRLRGQIEQGAPADVFASADREQIDAAIASKVIDPASVRLLCRNPLVVVASSAKDGAGGVEKIEDLARPGLRVVVADPAVPAGRYAMMMLDRVSALPGVPAGFKEAVLANIRSREENVRAVLAKVTLGEADAGIVYATDALAGGAAVKTIQTGIDLPAEYWVSVVERAKEQQSAKAWNDFLISAAGQRIMAAHGFIARKPDDK